MCSKAANFAPFTALAASVAVTVPATLFNTASLEPANAADVSEAAIEDLTIQIMQAVNNRGLKINLMPQSIHVSPSQWYETNRILKSVLQSNTAENNINVLKATNVFPKGIKMNHYFTSATAWFIRTNAPTSMKHYERDAIMFDQDNDFDTKNAKAACYERYSFGWSDWRWVYGQNA